LQVRRSRTRRPRLTCAAFDSLLYYFVPNRAVKPPTPWSEAPVAACVRDLKRSFALYIAKIPTYALVYGAFAVIRFFSSGSIFLGGDRDRALIALAPDFTVLRETARRPSGAGFGDVLEILLLLARPAGRLLG
jgi:hypothetical protein